MAVGSLAGRASCAAQGRCESLAACRSQPASHAHRASCLCRPPALSWDTRLLRRSCIIARSSSEPEASFPASMSLQEAYKLLGVSESAGFDEIMAAKKRCTKQSGSDKERVVQARAALCFLACCCGGLEPHMFYFFYTQRRLLQEYDCACAGRGCIRHPSHAKHEAPHVRRRWQRRALCRCQARASREQGVLRVATRSVML